MWSLNRIHRNAGNLSAQGEDPAIVAADMNLDRYAYSCCYLFGGSSLFFCKSLITTLITSSMI